MFAVTSPASLLLLHLQALALLYSNHLGQAAAVLEHAFQHSPAAMMQAGFIIGGFCPVHGPMRLVQPSGRP